MYIEDKSEDLVGPARIGRVTYSKTGKSLTYLYLVLPRPRSPVETGNDELWLQVAEKVGTHLPVDYVYFINSYGTGSINDFLTVLNPFSAHTYLNLIDQIPRILSGLRESREQFPEDYPYPLYFEPGGLLPWGLSIDGDIYCWLTKGNSPDLWDVVVVPRQGINLELFEMTMAKFLAGALRSQIDSEAIPTDFSQDNSFVPQDQLTNY